MCLANAVSGNIGWGWWSANFHKSNKEQDKAVNFAVNSSGTPHPHSGGGHLT